MCVDLRSRRQMVCLRQKSGNRSPNLSQILIPSNSNWRWRRGWHRRSACLRTAGSVSSDSDRRSDRCSLFNAPPSTLSVRSKTANVQLKIPLLDSPVSLGLWCFERTLATLLQAIARFLKHISIICFSWMQSSTRSTKTKLSLRAGRATNTTFTFSNFLITSFDHRLIINFWMYEYIVPQSTSITRIIILVQILFIGSVNDLFSYEGLTL